MLSSDILEAQFGPTHVVIASQDDSSRIVHTVVDATNQVLEVSYVTFKIDGRRAFPLIHQQVRKGASIGKAFRGNNVNFERVVSLTEVRPVNQYIQELFGSSDDATVVRVKILVGPDKLPYAEIIEAYSPAVTWPQ